jgi:hypothetical protein
MIQINGRREPGAGGVMDGKIGNQAMKPARFWTAINKTGWRKRTSFLIGFLVTAETDRTPARPRSTGGV